MKFPSAILSAARLACIAGAIAASFAIPSIADPDLREPDSALRQGSGAPAPQHLNLSALEQRVRDTRAISVFQKLFLQNEVGDLVARFRHAHADGMVSLAALRRPYDRLLANLQSMLERDPQLANEISASREAIWNVLTDRSQFAGL